MRKRAAGDNPGLETAPSLGFIVGSGLCLILSLIFATSILRKACGPPRIRAIERINPNVAPVASLARLPGIGLTRARAIEAFRRQFEHEQGHAWAFRRAEDLAQVKGIGPATIEGLRPWLRFDTAPGASKPLSE